MTEGERIEEILRYLNINASLFSKEIGASRADKVYNIIKGRNGISRNFSLQIIDKYPIFNYEWVLSGRGEMLKSGKSSNKEIELRVTTKQRQIPYYESEATASNLDQVMESTQDYVSEYIALPDNFPDSDLCIPVYGDSMYPTIKNGDIVALRQIKDLEIITYGEIFVIVTEEQKLVKRIKKGEVKENILLVSENENFDSFEIPRKKIKHLFIVTSSVKRNIT